MASRIVLTYTTGDTGVRTVPILQEYLMATKQKQQNLAQLFQAAIAGKKVSPSTKPAAKPKKGK